MHDQKVLLARPSSYIVDDMKRFIKDLGHTPIPLSDIADINNFNEHEVHAVVISTGLVSVVKQNYCEVIKKTIERFPNTSIFLAVHAKMDIVTKTIVKKVEGLGLGIEVSAISDADAFNDKGKNHVLMIFKDDLTDTTRYKKAFETFQSVTSYA